jgi:hypothetical protein
VMDVIRNSCFLYILKCKITLDALQGISVPLLHRFQWLSPPFV